MTAVRPTAPEFREGLRAGAIDFCILAVVVVLIAGTVKLVWREFTFFGDNAESFFPLWHMFGTAIRTGDPFLFDRDGWGAGNVVGEAAYGVFNPVTALNALFISLTDRISVTGFLVMVEFLVFLAWGVYMLARTYGAGRAASVLVGAVAPFAGYTMFYEAGNWASGLMSVVWVVHFWWSARTFAGGRIGPLTPVLFGFLAATVGNPYSVVGVLVVLAALGLELLAQRNYRRFVGLVVVGAVVGTAVLLTYLPLIAVLSQIDRPLGGELISNTNYLTPSLSDLLGLSAPTYLPRITAWFGIHDLVPSTYLSWLILPILPWIKWRALGQWMPNLSVLFAGLVFLMLTLGPDHLWLFRWPIRFVEYFYICLLVVLAMLISRGLASDFRRRRTILTVFAVGVGVYLSISSVPSLQEIHLIVALVIAVLALGIAFAYSRSGLRGILVLGVAGTAIIAPTQGWMFGWSHQDVAPGVNQLPPGDLSVVREAWDGVDGRILQIAELETLEGTGAVESGELVFGNIGAAAGLDIFNRYTGINFLRWKDGMAFDYRGTVGDWFPLSALSSPVADELPIPLVDAIGADTLVVRSDRRDIDELEELAGWHIVEATPVRTVLERDGPISHPVLFSPDGVATSAGAESGNHVSFHAETRSGGTVLLDRLAWTGYSATLDDGTTLPISTAPYGLMLIDIPAGTDATVHIAHEIPGLKWGAIAAGCGLLAAIVYQTLWWRRRPDRVSDPALNIADDSEIASDYSI
ncbi:MAG TPA: hypothetical protein VNP97_05400 [Microbacterium sp.]|nr:hypothetical protein [Microbacterium sp.]